MTKKLQNNLKSELIGLEKNNIECTRQNYDLKEIKEFDQFLDMQLWIH